MHCTHLICHKQGCILDLLLRLKASSLLMIAAEICMVGCRNHFAHLVSDFLVTLSLMMLHALILLCQGMAFSVAMNSKRNHALVGLIIAINFVEMKGSILLSCGLSLVQSCGVDHR